MRNKVGKIMLLAGMLCAMSLAVCACGSEKAVLDAKEQQAQPSEVIPQEEASILESASDEPKADGSNDSAESGTQKEQLTAEGASDVWVDSSPNLEGDIKELTDGQFTMIEVVKEELDGGLIMVGPGSGDDSEFNKIPVTYDENTLFKIQTIYDGGVRFEMSEATAADLTSGQFVKVWGNSSDSGMKATQICIVKVV